MAPRDALLALNRAAQSAAMASTTPCARPKERTIKLNYFGLYWEIFMEIKVNFLDKLRLEAKFDDFTVVADQPIRYKGDGSAPGPFDYFLASSALCAA